MFNMLLKVFSKLPSKIVNRLKQELDPLLYISHDKIIWMNDIEVSEKIIHQICLNWDDWECPKCIESVTNQQRLLLYGDIICRFYVEHYINQINDDEQNFKIRYFPIEITKLIISYTPITTENAEHFEWSTKQRDEYLYIRERMKELFKKLSDPNFEPTRGRILNLATELMVYLAIQDTKLKGLKHSNKILLDYLTENANLGDMDSLRL